MELNDEVYKFPKKFSIIYTLGEIILNFGSDPVSCLRAWLYNS